MERIRQMIVQAKRNFSNATEPVGVLIASILLTLLNATLMIEQGINGPTVGLFLFALVGAWWSMKFMEKHNRIPVRITKRK